MGGWSCDHMGGSCDILGRSCDLLGGSCDLLGGSCDILGGSCDLLGGSCDLMILFPSEIIGLMFLNGTLDVIFNISLLICIALSSPLFAR